MNVIPTTRSYVHEFIIVALFYLRYLPSFFGRMNGGPRSPRSVVVDHDDMKRYKFTSTDYIILRED